MSKGAKLWAEYHRSLCGGVRMRVGMREGGTWFGAHEEERALLRVGHYDANGSGLLSTPNYVDELTATALDEGDVAAHLLGVAQGD